MGSDFMKCCKCKKEMYKIYGENNSVGLACLCGYYFWLDNVYKYREYNLEFG